MPSDDDDLLALQERLRTDRSGAERLRLQNLLAELRRAVKEQMDAGVPPRQFSSLQQLLDAVETGEELLLATWRSYHPASPA
jgi:hypothetical protein